MKILLTGGSSFTGAWFARELAHTGHHVVVPLRRSITEYSGVRRERVLLLQRSCELMEGCEFGSTRFLDLIGKGEPFDILCHHAASVENYRSPDFDIAAAFVSNTRNGEKVLRNFADQGGKGVVITGSVFEAREGSGSEPRRAFSPYGVSKTISAEYFAYWCGILGLPLGKFVIPNPFGPYEEPRFCAYLAKAWARAEIPAVKTPHYVRDNIHVSLLAKVYRDFLSGICGRSGFVRANPSGYVESQGAFAERLARELGRRLRIQCRVTLAEQEDFSEPMVRLNFDRPDQAALGWYEEQAWDELAEYYSRAYFDDSQRVIG